MDIGNILYIDSKKTELLPLFNTKTRDSQYRREGMCLRATGLPRPLPRGSRRRDMMQRTRHRSEFRKRFATKLSRFAGCVQTTHPLHCIRRHRHQLESVPEANIDFELLLASP
jgi:hypothetical protein